MFDTPISELALVGAAFGAAVSGKRPVIEIMFGDFLPLVMDGIINQATKHWYLSNEQGSCPLVVLSVVGAGGRFGAIHSQTPIGWFHSIPGLKIACPSNSGDAKSLLKQAIRDDNPVLFLEHKRLLGLKSEVDVDWEQRVDYPRLRAERLEKAAAALRSSDLGAVLLFDQNNIRYVTSTHIGEWARDKSARCALLPRDGRPGPVGLRLGGASHHQLYAPWLPDSSWRAGVSSMRGAMPGRPACRTCSPSHIFEVLREHGLESEPLGIDLTDMETLASLHRRRDPDRRRPAGDARGAQDQDGGRDRAARPRRGDRRRGLRAIYEMLRPGIREHEIVADAQRLLFELGSEQVEAINAVSGDRCNPHPHVFSDRLLRPGDQAFFDIIHSFMGYRTCYYRTFCVGGATQSQLDAYKQCREWLDAAIELVRPGRHDRPDRRGLADGARSSGSPARRRASACSSGTASASACTRRR